MAITHISSIVDIDIAGRVVEASSKRGSTFCSKRNLSAMGDEADCNTIASGSVASTACNRTSQL
jgi:hypothetical protein